MSFMAKLPFNRPLAALVLLTFCINIGCSNVRTVGTGQLTPDEAESLVGELVRFYTEDGEHTHRVTRVDYPYIEWTHKDRPRTSDPSQTIQLTQGRLDLRKVHKVEIVRGQGTTLLLVFVILFVTVIVAIAIYEGPSWEIGPFN